MQRSYTFVYAWSFNLVVAILIGLSQTSGWIQSLKSPLIIFMILGFIYFGLLANYRRFIKKTQFLKWECWLSAAILGFVPAVLWLLFLTVLQLTGAEME